MMGEQKMNKQKAIVLDIDNVVLSSGFILQEIFEQKLKGDAKWDYFYQHCNSDRVKLMSKIIPFIRSFPEDVVTIISTARSERCRRGTAKKLWQYKIGFEEMYMRALDDYRPAEEVKREHLQKIMENYDVICFVDDSLENCEMAKDMGILALRCV